MFSFPFWASSQWQSSLGDFCIPGTCTCLSSNCKRVGGSAFRCVCKEQYMSVNKTHCSMLQDFSSIKRNFVWQILVRVINSSIDSVCKSCIERGGVCLDEDSDNHMDRCFCQTDSDLCNGITTSSSSSSTIVMESSSKRCLIWLNYRREKSFFHLKKFYQYSDGSVATRSIQ